MVSRSVSKCLWGSLSVAVCLKHAAVPALIAVAAQLVGRSMEFNARKANQESAVSVLIRDDLLIIIAAGSISVDDMQMIGDQMVVATTILRNGPHLLGEFFYGESM